jgi:hypothetical protein
MELLGMTMRGENDRINNYYWNVFFFIFFKIYTYLMQKIYITQFKYDEHALIILINLNNSI